MDTLFLALRVVVSLGAVLAAIWFLRKWVTKGGRRGAVRGRHVEVVSRASLGPKSSIALVRAGDKQYLLGVTEHAITVLDTPELISELSIPSAPAVAPVLTTVPRDFDRALDAARSEVAHIEATPSGAITLHPATRRAMREREQAQQRSPIAGSILSASTWKQTAQALRRAQ